MSTLQLLSLLALTAGLFGWVSSRWLKIPITIGTMLLTVAASLGLLWLSHGDPRFEKWAAGLTSQISFEHLILHGMLPFLLFAAAFLLDLEYLAREKLLVTVFSLGGTVISTLATALLMAWLLPLIGLHPAWIECLIFGALISPTDPIAVVEMLRRVGAPKRLQAQLAGESLFNDGVGAVLFLAFLEASRGATPSVLQVGWLLVLEAGGGLLLGVAAAWVCSYLMRFTDAFQLEILFTIGLAVGGYALAEMLHLSPPLEAVAAGLALRYWNQKHPEDSISHEGIDRVWTVIDEMLNGVLFVLLGLEVLEIHFDWQLLRAGGTAVISVTAVRVIVVAALVTIVRLVQRGHPISIAAMTWGGLRGGLSLALAFSVPAGAGRGWIVATTYVVVLFSIVVQGGALELMLRRRAPQESV